MNASRNYFTSGLAWVLTFMLIIGWQIMPFMPSQHIPPAEAAGEKMILLWDAILGGLIPIGWSNASLTYGGYFLRGDTVANVGNPTTPPPHSHTQNTVAITQSTTGSSFKRKSNTRTALSTHNHDSIDVFTMDDATPLPEYRNLIAITYDSGIPTTLPQYAIALFDGSLGAGFSSYSSQNTKMIRIDSTSGGTGGTIDHSHTNLTIVTSGPNATASDITSGADGSAATETHIHIYSATSPLSTDHTPLHTEVILGSVTNSGGTNIPVDMIAMFNGDPNIEDSNWDIISDGGEAFGGVFIEAQSSYQTGQGSTTHNHSINTASPVESATIGVGSGSPGTSIATSHTHTISGDFSDENNEPPYINVVVAKKQASFTLSVTGPEDVTLASIKPSETGETTFAGDELVIIIDGGEGWSLTVEVTTTLTEGGSDTIPDANVYIRKDGNVDGVPSEDVYTIWAGETSDLAETEEIVSLDTAKSVGIRSSGTGDDTTTVRPTIQVVADLDQKPADYDGVLRFTVA